MPPCAWYPPAPRARTTNPPSMTCITHLTCRSLPAQPPPQPHPKPTTHQGTSSPSSPSALWCNSPLHAPFVKWRGSCAYSSIATSTNFFLPWLPAAAGLFCAGRAHGASSPTMTGTATSSLGPCLHPLLRGMAGACERPLVNCQSPHSTSGAVFVRVFVFNRVTPPGRGRTASHGQPPDPCRAKNPPFFT